MTEMSRTAVMGQSAAHDATRHAPSYYAASGLPQPPRPALRGTVRADVCVIGAGYTGLSTALHLAEAGFKVVVLEAAKVGWGASGRNGGQIVNSYSRDLDVIEARHGTDTARPWDRWPLKADVSFAISCRAIRSIAT